MKVALAVAGSDSSGGAGLQADLKTFAAFGVHGTSAVTALTAQGASGIHETSLVAPAFVRAQIEAVARDFEVAAVKTGMLGNEAIVTEVARALKALRLPNLVVDPVMRASTGETLFEGSFEGLLSVARVLTPNLGEAEALLGHPVPDLQAMRGAVKELRALGPDVIVLKGGHLPGDPVDVYFDGERVEELRAQRIEAGRTHGTGCTFASAMAACLALGKAPYASAIEAKAYVEASLHSSYTLGGRRFLDHKKNGESS